MQENEFSSYFVIRDISVLSLLVAINQVEKFLGFIFITLWKYQFVKLFWRIIIINNVWILKVWKTYIVWLRHMMIFPKKG